MKDSIVDKITQIILIVFSVVLGLYLSERLEDRKNEREADKLLSKVKAELKDNRRILDEWVPYHREVVESMDSIFSSEEFINDFIENRESFYGIFPKETMMGETPSDDAWDIAKSHPLIVNLDYDELLVLSKVYNQQKFAYDPLHKLIDILLSPDFNQKDEARSNLQMFRNRFENILGLENQLVRYYDQAEEILQFEDRVE